MGVWLTFYFISGPRDGEQHRAMRHLQQVVMELEQDPDSYYVPSPTDTHQAGMVGTYTRIGNLLVWEGWKK